jgi:hypothetical protein
MEESEDINPEEKEPIIETETCIRLRIHPYIDAHRSNEIACDSESTVSVPVPHPVIKSDVVFPSEQFPLQVPLTAQLQLEFQVTPLGL